MQQARLFQIVWALQQGPSTAAALARRFEVSVRTIQRDIDALSGAGVPVYCTRGRGGGIGLLPGFVLDRSYLTGAEQREVLLGLQSLAAAGEADAGSALQKLAGLFQRPEESWLQVDFAQWGAGPEEKRAFEQVRGAILAHRRVAFTYYSSQGEHTERTAEPVRLVFKDGFWYIQAFCCLRGAARVFKLCRIAGLRVLDEQFAPGPRHAPFPLEEEGPMPSVLRLRLLFRPDVAYRVYDFFRPSQVARVPDGSFLVTAEFPDTPWVDGFLLSFGAQVAVLEPEAVRRRVESAARRMLELYGAPSAASSIK